LSVIAAGKASAPMAAVAAEHLGPQVRVGLVVSATQADVPPPFQLIVGGHPTPSPLSEVAGVRALEIADSLAADETLLVLLSGGASSLMAAPASGVTLDDKRRTTKTLMHAGADIHALNTVRKHLSAIKGGQLAARARGRSVAYAISDVVGDDLSVIGSGPTVPDSTRFADALQILRRFGGLDAYPRAAVDRLTRGAAGDLEETPKPGDPRIARARTTIIGGRGDAMAGAAAEADRRGYHVLTMREPVDGEARTAARRHLEHIVAQAEATPRPTCIVSSGETVVTVKGTGKGGRNQEFALAWAQLLGTGLRTGTGTSYSDPSNVGLASLGTDGIDGPTDAAGALADSTTLVRAREKGIDNPHEFLDNNDAYRFFDRLGDLIHTGPTDTNVGDLQIVLLG
jgi:glycerate 2-kinase